MVRTILADSAGLSCSARRGCREGYYATKLLIGTLVIFSRRVRMFRSKVTFEEI